MMLKQRELSALEEQLKSEKVAVLKSRANAEMAEDEEIKEFFNHCAQKHETHYAKLLSFLNESSNVH